MFGIGVQEMVLVGALLLILFGPKKLPQMARDIGRFVNEARRSVEEFKEDLVSEKEDSREPREGQQEELEVDEGLEEDGGCEEVASRRAGLPKH